MSEPLTCQICGAGPAAAAHFRSVIGMIVWQKVPAERGNFCRDCGLWYFRETTSETLAKGWWGPVPFVLTPFVLLWNLLQRPKVARLAPPTARTKDTLDPGRPVYLRLSMLGLLVPLALLAFIVSPSRSVGPEVYVGHCVVMNAEGGAPAGFVSCDSPNDGLVLAYVDDPDKCPAEATGYVRRQTSGAGGLTVPDDGVWCIKVGK